jgi:cob(I)alamin adenosyltransferase
MKIYTKTGDNGMTSLVGGTRVEKFHLRLECYGTIDELNSHIGLLFDLTENDEIKNILSKIQHSLFNIGSYLANEKLENKEISTINQSDILFLENKMDEFVAELPELKNFILPSGHILASQSHIARTVCRRAERNIVKLSQEIEVNEIVLKYVNRLSDFLFILARKFLKDFNKMEITWNPIL